VKAKNTGDRMKKQAENILKKEKIRFMNIVPVGHHNLNRNYVFLVKGQEDYILKIYGKDIKYLCEKKALEIFASFDETPKLKAFGKENVYPWILMTKVEGQLLQEKWGLLSTENKIILLESIGSLLGRLHIEQHHNYFGLWKDLSPASPEKSFIRHRMKNDEKIIKKIRDQNLPNTRLFEKAFEELSKLYKKLNPEIESTICHRDYSLRNILVGHDEITLKGLIDFEHCQIDDPAIDFNTLYQHHMLDSKENENAFFKGYEKHKSRSEDFLERKKYYMINLGLHTCSWSYNTAHDFFDSGVGLLQEIL